MQVPRMISLDLMDEQASKVAEGPLYAKGMSMLNLPDFIREKPLSFIASDYMLHLFILTLFIAYIAPFGAFVYSALRLSASTEL